MKKGKTSTRQSDGSGKKGKNGARPEENWEGARVERKAVPELGAQAKRAGARVLAPLLSKREGEPAFVEALASKANEVILLLVIDTNAMAGEFGFATNEIAVGNALMQKIKELVGKKRKTCRDIMEWGDTATKIEHMAQLYLVDKLCMVKQANHFYKTLVKGLKENLKGIEIEEVKLHDWQP